VDIKRIISELQRRHVTRVAGTYAVVGWVVIQVATTVFPLLGLSEAAAKIAIILIVLGFPLAIAFAWAFDITPTGVQRTEALPDHVEPPAPSSREYGRAAGFFGVGILVALVAFAALSRVRSDHAEKTAAGVRSIAVLPFVDMSQNQDQAYFADGITEELLNRLAQIPNIRVPARTSTFAYRASTLGIDEIAHRLKVEAVLEGSVRRDSNNVRVTARLVDAKTQTKLWSNEYDREVSSIFAIQDEIATDIVNALKLQLSEQPVKAVAGVGDIKAAPAAVDAYMKGLELFNQRTEAGLRKAVTLFENAVEKDPEFALGYAMLAQAYAVVPLYSAYPVFEASSKGQAAAARALQLNPSLAEAYAALGQIRQNFEWDFESAERSYRRAILFNNGYATAHQWRAEALLLLGKYEDSRAEIDAALDLDPVSPSAMFVKAYQHVVRREFPAATRMLDRIIAANPEFSLALVGRAAMALMARQPQVAAPHLNRLANGSPALTQAFAAVTAASADPARRNDALRLLNAVRGRANSEMALWYMLAGLPDQALARLKSADESGADPLLPIIVMHPAFDPIRSKPDFQSILSDLRMQPAQNQL
jgi:TolB-like protein